MIIIILSLISLIAEAQEIRRAVTTGQHQKNL